MWSYIHRIIIGVCASQTKDNYNNYVNLTENILHCCSRPRIKTLLIVKFRRDSWKYEFVSKQIVCNSVNPDERKMYLVDIRKILYLKCFANGYKFKFKLAYTLSKFTRQGYVKATKNISRCETTCSNAPIPSQAKN